MSRKRVEEWAQSLSNPAYIKQDIFIQIFTPEERKDEKYWEKRCKNNVAARRSREARRLKENQIALRAAYLEKQNMHLRVTLKSLNIENANIRLNVEALMSRIKKKEKEISEKKSQAQGI